MEDTSKVASEEWTKARLFKELKISEIEGITATQSSELKRILWKYKECFSHGPFDLGQCNMFTAEINLRYDYSPTWEIR